MAVGTVRPVVAVDLDGTLTAHKTGYKPGPLTEPPLPGIGAWLRSLAPSLQIVVFSARAEMPDGVSVIRNWLNDQGLSDVPVTITAVKPATAVLYIDDRGWQINGKVSDYPTVEQILAFRPWWDTGPEHAGLAPISGSAPDALAASLAARAASVEWAVTDTMNRAVAAADGLLVGLEYRLKKPDALAAKIRNVAAEKNLTSRSAAEDIKDALRYAVVFDGDVYANGTRAVLAVLDAAGLTVSRIRNYWAEVDGSRYGDGTYVGLNVVLVGLDGFPVETQFHTPQSLDAQRINMGFYRQIRAGNLDTADRDVVDRTMRQNNGFVPRPDGIDSFGTARGTRWWLLADGEATDDLGVIPGDVHYRPAPEPSHSCATCQYYDTLGTRCTMYDAPVSPSYLCDKWARIESDHTLVAALPGRPKKTRVVAVPADAHNRILDAANRRANELEPKLAAIIAPLLAEAGVTAARNFRARATNFLTAAADIQPDSMMVAVVPRPDEAAAIAQTGGEPPADLHVTLAYLGQVPEEDVDRIRAALAVVAGTHPPLEGTVGGVGAFADNGNGVPAIALPDVPGLIELRQAVVTALAEAEIDYGRGHGFQPHATIAYRPPGDDASPDREAIGQPLHFDSLRIVRGNHTVADMPLTGAPSLTAASDPGTPNPPQWASPAPSELLDAQALVAAIKARTEPIRRAFIEQTMTPALKAAGLSWDVTHPLIAGQLSKQTMHITSIADTTRSNVMAIIGESYKQGLSIPDTAEAIQSGMQEASLTRATLIARTELSGAVNGSSLTATRIVADATGQPMIKRWMTAPGAAFPRHELVDGLDGQERGLDEPFDVDGDSLMFPGDPDGPVENVANCRCVGPMTRISGKTFAATRRMFEGNLLRLVTARGRDLSVTPNHPVLTGRGWVAAGLLQKGDDLICGTGFRDAASSPDEEDVPSAAHERFASLQLSAAWSQGVPAGAVNFHGEIPVGEVDVVVADRELTGELVSAFQKHLLQLGLALAHREVHGSCDERAGGRVEDEQVGVDRFALVLREYGCVDTSEADSVGVTSTANRQVVGLEDPRDGRARHPETLAHGENARPAVVSLNHERDEIGVTAEKGEVVSLTCRPSSDASPECLPDCHRREANLAADLLVRFSGFVETDPLVDVALIRFRGHVYNFSSLTGTYMANDIITANCTISYVEGGEEVGTADADTGGDVPDQGE